MPLLNRILRRSTELTRPTVRGLQVSAPLQARASHIASYNASQALKHTPSNDTTAFNSKLTGPLKRPTWPRVITKLKAPSILRNFNFTPSKRAAIESWLPPEQETVKITINGPHGKRIRRVSTDGALHDSWLGDSMETKLFRGSQLKEKAHKLRRVSSVPDDLKKASAEIPLPSKEPLIPINDEHLPITHPDRQGAIESTLAALMGPSHSSTEEASSNHTRSEQSASVKSVTHNSNRASSGIIPAFHSSRTNSTVSSDRPVSSDASHTSTASEASHIVPPTFVATNPIAPHFNALNAVWQQPLVNPFLEPRRVIRDSVLTNETTVTT